MIGEIAGGVGSALGSIFGGGGADEDRIRQIIESLDPVDRETLLKEAQAGSSAYEDVTSDPSLRKNQMAEITALRSLADQGGMGIQERTALNEAMDQTAAQEQMQRGAITQGMAARGMGGSGTELASALANQQGAATRNAKAGAQAASDAATRRIQALRDMGTASGNVRNQDWGEASQKASAQDAMSRFNASQRLGAENQAWNQQYQRAGLATGQYGDMAEQTRRRGSSVGEALGQTAGGLYDYYNKKDEEGV